MIRRFYALCALLVLVGCGGGGRGGSTFTPAALPTATAAPVANTALPYYAPFRTGNRWTFATSGYFLDGGSKTLVCTCSYNGKPVENWEIYSATTGAYGASYIMAKLSSTGVSTLFLIGLSLDHANTFSTLTDASGNTGIQVMTDSPVAGTSWSQSGYTSVLSNVGASFNMADGRVVNSVATDTFTSSAGATSWAFAKGIGPAQIFFSDGTNTKLFSFTVDATNSSATERRPQSIALQTGVAAAGDAQRALELLR